MRYGVGIDLGTSFTSAAINGPNGIRMVPMSPEVIVPSVAYRASGGALLTGHAALAPATNPALATRNFKRRLGDPTPLVLGGSTYSPAALMAAQLRDVLATVTRATGGPPDSVMLTYPAIWGPYRREHFTEVPRLAHVPDFRLITEPEAAATHYSTERRLGNGETIAVYDLGGGTFDTTILRVRSGRMEILGTPEGIEHLGGIDFDEALLAHLDQRLDGAISELDTADPRQAAARTAIQTMCVRAKEELSTEPDVHLSVPLPSGPRDITITRIEFNDMIRPSVQLTIDALHTTTTSAGLRADDLSAVLLAGGSSRVPLVGQKIAEEFNKPVRGTLHPKYTVALGAALVSAHPRPVTSPRAVPASNSPNASAARNAPEAPAAPTPAAARSGPRRRKWLVPAIATAATLLIGTAVTLFATAGPAAPSGPLPIYDGAPVTPFSGYIGSGVTWEGTPISPDDTTEHPPYLTTAPDPNNDGFRVNWTDTDPSQIYLQTTNPKSSLDISPYVDNGGALVFDAKLHARPGEGTTSVQVHCHHPCAAELPSTKLFDAMPIERPTTVKIPLSCFVAAGLDPKKVDTPFLVYSRRLMDVTFSHIRLEPGAANDADATPCGKIH